MADDTAPAPSPRRWPRVLALLALLLALTVAGGSALTWWLWQSPRGLSLTVSLLDRVLPAHVSVQNPSGSFAEGFALDSFSYEAPTLSIRIERLRASALQLQPALSLAGLRIAFDELAAERVTVRVRPSATPSPPGPPASIASPLSVEAGRLAVGAFELVTGSDASPTRIAARSIDTGIAIGPAGYTIRDGRFAFGPEQAPLQAELSGTLAGARPFDIDARGRLRGSLREKPMQAAVTASGSLVDLRVGADVETTAADAPPGAGEPRGKLALRVASFEPPALRELVADLENIDPAAWVEGAPSALLTVHAELKPQPGPRFSVKGPVKVDNRRAGAVDAQRIPVRSARATIEASADALSATDIVAELARGSARGRFDIGFAQLDRWQAQAQFSGVDPATIHTRAQPLTLDGDVAVEHESGDTAVTGRVRNRGALPLEGTVDLRASAARVLLNVAQLKLGSGQAMVAGEIELQGARALRAAGSVVEFDPSLLVTGVDARLTGTFNVNGVLSPQPAGTASFGLAESQAYGRPVVGRGVLTLSPDQLLDVDATLGVRTATLSAKGGLGGAGRQLVVELLAPQLRELGLPGSGRISASARLTGEWRAPAVDAQLEATSLVWGDHRIAEAQAVARYSGGKDGELSLQATASNHRFQRNPMLSLQTAILRAEGRLSEHRIEFNGNNEEAQPLVLAVAGGWQPAAAAQPARKGAAATPARRAEWRGRVQTVRAGRPLDAQLVRPADLVTDFSQWALGPAELLVSGARVEELRVDLADGVFSTSGRFSEFRPSQLRGGGSNLLSTPAGRSNGNAVVPIALRGQWSVRLGTQADGNVLIERSGGDIVVGTQAMGIRDIRAELAVRANRLQASARLDGERAGRVDAQLSAEVEKSADGWRLAQQRPLSGRLDADLPSIAWVNALLSDAVRANVRLGGAAIARLRVEGTPADPDAQGTIAGQNLRVAWIEQGIRLERGTLNARIEGGAIVLDELRFTGEPQVRPADRRPLEALAKEESQDPGFLGMNGRLQLRDLSGVLQVQAVRMPFLQRPDRWVLATGGANIVFDRKQVQMNGAVLANAGFVDFSRRDLPSLSNDVQVLRATDPPATRDAPIGINFDLGIDLGPAFYLRGAGLDTRVEGQLRLRAEGRGAIRATGAVEARGGVYEGFGQKLAIERGRVNFQGPLENPGLDVLAVRRGLPVEVGVSITRTAQNPLVKLYSDQPMPDIEILSWLVLGRPAQEGGQDRAALATAAAGLLSGSGEGLTTQLARRLGIDEISLRSGEVGGAGSLLPRSSVAGSVRGDSSANLSGDIVTIGKRLSDNITISFEQAVAGTASVVQISYQLTRRLSVLARAGTENALDLVYSVAFD